MGASRLRVKTDNDFLSTLLSLHKFIPSFDAIQNEILTALLNKQLMNNYQLFRNYLP